MTDALARVKADLVDWPDKYSAFDEPGTKTTMGDLRALVREVEAGRTIMESIKSQIPLFPLTSNREYLQAVVEAYDAARKGTE